MAIASNKMPPVRISLLKRPIEKITHSGGHQSNADNIESFSDIVFDEIRPEKLVKNNPIAAFPTDRLLCIYQRCRD
jgi:hypothetical protein